VVLGAGSDEPVATITDTEIVKAIADGQDLEEARISEIVAENKVTVDADVRADDAARLMLSQGLDSLPVMQGRRIIGIVELADLRGVSQGSGPVTAAKATL
jgi:CBS domain-containing protein